MLKKFLIWLVRTLIALLLVTLVFSTITLDFPNLIKGVFGDIYAYASPESQKQAVSKIAETCTKLDSGSNVVTMNKICANSSLLGSMRENCENFYILRRKGVGVENEQQVLASCNQIDSSTLETTCNNLNKKNPFLPDLSNVSSLCKDYSAGKITDKEFFFDFIGRALPSNLEAPKVAALDRLNKFVDYLNKNRVIYFVILSALIIVLYLLINNFALFLITLSSICLSIGILIMLPYFIIFAYDKFVGIETTGILGNMFGTSNIFDYKAVISVILLLFSRTYNILILTVGILFLSVGVAGKVYGLILKRTLKRQEINRINTKQPEHSSSENNKNHILKETNKKI